MHRILATSVLCSSLIAAAFSASTQARAQDDSFWTLRGVAGLPASTLIELARASQPIWQVVEAQSQATLRGVVDEICGEQPPEAQEFILSEALRLNYASDLDAPIEPNAAVAVPFCLKVQRNVPVEIEEGDTIERMLAKEYGVFGPRTIDQVFELNADAFEATSLEQLAAELPIGQDLVLPFASEIRTFAARAGAEETLESILGALDEQTVAPLENSVATAEASPEREPFQFRLVDSVDPASVGEGVACSEGTSADPLVDIGLFSERFTIEEEAKQNFDEEPAQTTVVGIIDTGLKEVGDNFFKEDFFWPNRNELGEAEPNDVDDDSSGFTDDIYGINFNNRTGRITPYATDAKKSHGTMMAALALGGPEIAQTWTGARTPSLIRLKIVNFASSGPQGGMVPAENLSSAIVYLAKQGARIVNMSLSSGQNIVPVSNTILAHPNVLFVVAAGNAKEGGRDLRLEPLVFPARYGGPSGDHRRHVLTVGAHGPSGSRADFSNFSAKYVDLLAPGCGVETRDIDGSMIHDNGTSPATAIVSFASAVVASLGLVEPNKIKNRILASVDFDESLDLWSWSSGRVNILKAISLRNDVVQLKNGDYLFGKIADAEELTKFCGDEALRPSLTKPKKIVANIATANGTRIEFWTESDNLLERIRCPQTGTGSDSIGPVGEAAGPTLAEVNDITFASFR